MKKFTCILSALYIGALVAHSQQPVNDSSTSIKVIIPSKIEVKKSNKQPSIQATVTSGGTAMPNYISKFTSSSNIEQSATPIFEDVTNLVSEIIVTDIFGKIIQNSLVQSNNVKIDLRENPRGVYFVKVISKEKTIVKK